MDYYAKNHTFVICAYKTCAFLEECIESLENQTVKSRILMSTSTPNDYIRSLAEKHNIPLFINNGPSGIAEDWNFALSCAGTELVTLAHQDDVYKPDYTEHMLHCMNRAKDPIFFFSRYGEIRDGKEVYNSPLLRVKNFLCFPLRFSRSSKFSKHFCLAFGNGICCPTVTYLTDVIRDHPFSRGLGSNLDWEKWAELSELNGSFVYSGRLLVFHRIHPDAETTKYVQSHRRGPEDFEMFRKFWPKPVAKLITKLYSSGERTYKDV